MNQTTSPAVVTDSERIRPLRATVAILARVGFGLWLVLSLSTPSWRYGPFSWWPLYTFEELAGGPMPFGALNLLPAFIIFCWLVARLRSEAKWSWRWGRVGVTLPLVALVLFSGARLEPALNRHMFIYAGAVALVLFVYFFAVNERPNLTLPLSLIVVIQAGVGLAQFWRQRDLGLIFLGELPLHPGWEGITVLSARGRPWLRAYGLTAHPNLLGGLLAVILLLLLAAYRGSERKQRLALGVVLTAGMLGLLVTFSRAAWLGFAAGLLLWLVGWNKARHEWLRGWRKLLLLLPVLLVLFLYRDLVFSRFLALNTPVEVQSITDRVRDAELAARIIGKNLWTGVGLGSYVAVAQSLNADAARVHNVPLLVTAELGLPGFILWLWLISAPFILALRSRRLDTARLAPWLAMIVVNFFDTTLWWSSNWQTAILFALLAAHLTGEVARSGARTPPREPVLEM